MLAAENILRGKSIFLILLLCFLPVYIPILAKYEGLIFPVTKNTKIIEERGQFCPACETQMVDIFLEFEKVRQCEFLNLSWYDPQGRRGRVQFEDLNEAEPLTRTTGPQIVGPWRIHGIYKTEGSRAVVEHQCHPFYRTYSEFYP